MNELVLSRAQVRQVDRVAIDTWRVSGLVLMENAGRGAADALLRRGIAGRVVICCAKGNNGGDGFVIARHLHLRGVEVEVVLCAEAAELAGDALANFQLLRRCAVPVHPLELATLGARFRDADWIVDALLGTGATGEVRAPLDVVVQAINASAARCYAVDLPTGLDCDRGAPTRFTVRATATGTFVARKKGFHAGAPWLGEVDVLDIGLPQELVEAAIAEPNASRAER